MAPQYLTRISESLSDEVKAINAIYGETTFQIVSIMDEKVRALFRLPTTTYMTDRPVFDWDKGVWTVKRQIHATATDVAFFIDFPSGYPTDSPVLRGLDASMQEYRERSLWRYHLLMFCALQQVFVSGLVCMFDLVELVLPLLTGFTEDGLDLARLQTVVPEFDGSNKRWRWTYLSFVDMAKAFVKTECAICLDVGFGFEMVPFFCGHFFCFDCFQSRSKSSPLLYSH